MSKAKRAFEIFISLAILSLIVMIVFGVLIVEKTGNEHTNTIVIAVFAGVSVLFVSVAMAVMMTHTPISSAVAAIWRSKAGPFKCSSACTLPPNDLWTALSVTTVVGVSTR